MDAKAKALREILHSGDQFLVPFFQRFYSWHRAQWDRLWSDLRMLLEDPSREQHFLGPLVCAALKAAPGEIHAFQLIDGQQRITTLSVLLAALRDVAKSQGDEELAAKIHETYLVHRFQKGWRRFKLLPRTGDREAFAAIVLGESTDAFGDLGLVQAYRFFRKAIRHELYEGESRLAELFEAVVSRLYLVVITIGEENPYEIFESLNSTGLSLEESDLIRNFVFMKLPLEEHDEFHEHRWAPYEQLFDATADYPSTAITPFSRDYLMRNGMFSRLRETFVDFKSQYEQAHHTPVSVADDLTRYAKFYLAIHRGVHPDLKVAEALAQFKLVDAATAHPLLLNLMDRLDRGEIGKEEFVGCVNDLASFVVRRTVCGDQTGAYGKWFCEVIPQLGKSPQNTLRRYLIHRGWPDDSTFEDRLREFPIYKRDPKKCRLMLHLLEKSFGHKEMVNLKPLQIEHVMPQSLPPGQGSASWKRMLGDGWKAVHERLLHTVGNLTLTGYNPNLSNRPYSEKRAELLNSNVILNKWFTDKPEWTEGAIEERSQALVEKLTSLLSRPEGGTYEPLAISIDRSNSARERRGAYWSSLIDLLGKRHSPWLPLLPSEFSSLLIPLPAYDVQLEVKLLPPKREIVVRMAFSRARGKSMFAALKSEAGVINQECEIAPQWVEGDSPEIRASLSEASIRDPLDWLDQHEWIADRLADFHRAFFSRLALLHESTKEKNPHHQMLFEYWCGFHDHLRAAGSKISGVKPLPQVWNDFALGKTACWLSALCNPTEKRIAVHMVLGGDKGAERFEALEKQREVIEGEIGDSLIWSAPAENKQKHIIIRQEYTDPTDIADREAQYAWIRDKLEVFHRTFQPRVQAF